jgi:hypothetical protein
MAKLTNPKPETDGFATRDVTLVAPEGAPYGDVSLVVRRATNRLDLERNRLADRLLAHLETLDVYRPIDELTQRYVGFFVKVLVLTLWAEGLPGFDDWDGARRAHAGPALAVYFERWLDLDGVLSDAWFMAVHEANSSPKREPDPKSASESASVSGEGTTTDS